MSSQIDEYKKLVEESEIPAEDKSLWLKNADILDGTVLENLIYLLKEAPKNLAWLNDNLKKKINAIKSGDQNTWNQILTEEKNTLKEI